MQQKRSSAKTHQNHLLVRYSDSLYISVLPVRSGTGCVLSSCGNALGSSPT
jgi:hypothetical protein